MGKFGTNCVILNIYFPVNCRCSLITAMYPLRAQQIAQIVLIGGGGPTPLAPSVKDDHLPPFSCIYNVLHPLFYCGLKR